MSTAAKDAIGRAARLALLLLAVAALAAGCGGDGGGDAEEQDEAVVEENPVAQAAETTIAEPSASVHLEASFEGPEGPYSFTADGETAFETFRSRLAYDLSNVPDGGENAEVRIDGQTVFVRFAEGAQGVELPEGKEWVRLPPQVAPDPEAGEEQAQQTVDVGGIQQDPTTFLRYLASGATDVQEEGTEEVRGSQTTIYTALIDLDRVVESDGEALGQDEEQRAAALRGAEALRDQLGDPAIPVTVNVDEEGRVVRLLLSLDIVGSGGARVSALTTTDFFDFGGDVDVAPPPEEQVVDAADVG